MNPPIDSTAVKANLRAFIQRLSQNNEADYVTRFAPSPTGYLHLGHLASAIFTWGIADILGAKVLLRIEDHDSGRSRSQFAKQIVKDLNQFSFIDAKTDISYQSDKLDKYKRAIAHLRSNGLLYACDCPRKKIIADDPNHLERNELYYGGFCRHRQLDFLGKKNIRLVLKDSSIDFYDGFLGAITQTPSKQCGDLPLINRVGDYTYHFCVVLDDINQGVNLIIRGQDLVDSTGRQIMLWQHLTNSPPPFYAHHPLIFDDKGQKLSKQFHSDSIAKMLESGMPIQEVLGMAAYQCGLIPKPQKIKRGDLASLIYDFIA